MSILEHFLEARSILDQFLNNPQNMLQLKNAGDIMVECLRNGGKILSCGNGGSMCDAIHFAEELSGRYRDDRPALSAIAMADPGHLTCVSNDYGYEFVFSRYIEAMGREGDVLLGISTSGSSKNVIRAIEAAHKKGMKVVCLTGKDGGPIAGLADVEIRAPYSPYADRAQEIHIKCIHALIDFIEVNV